MSAKTHRLTDNNLGEAASLEEVEGFSLASPIVCQCGCEVRKLVSPMNCPYCQRPLMKIDYYGEVLIGCIECYVIGLCSGQRVLVHSVL
jgi:hypothetical protein